MNKRLTTKYGILTSFYFHKILKEIIKIGNLDNLNLSILDFGCGYGELKKLLGNRKNIINYDIKPEFTDVEDWKSFDFDVIVVNQVFYTFSQEELEKVLNEFIITNPKAVLIVGISNQNVFNKLAAFITLNFDAHKDTVLDQFNELSIIKKFAHLENKKNVLGLSTIYYFKLNSI